MPTHGQRTQGFCDIDGRILIRSWGNDTTPKSGFELSISYEDAQRLIRWLDSM